MSRLCTIKFEVKCLMLGMMLETYLVWQALLEGGGGGEGEGEQASSHKLVQVLIISNYSFASGACLLELHDSE